MLRHELRSKVVAKLANARCELEDALKLSIPAARYDPVVIPEATRSKLLSMVHELKTVHCVRSKVPSDGMKWRIGDKLLR